MEFQEDSIRDDIAESLYGMVVAKIEGKQLPKESPF
jgi:hypothetical protein